MIPVDGTRTSTAFRRNSATLPVSGPVMTRSAAVVRSLLASIVLLAACSTAKDDSQAQIDSALARDLELASSHVSPSDEIAFGDTALSPVGSSHTPGSKSVSAAAGPAVSPPPATPVRKPTVNTRPDASADTKPTPKPVQKAPDPMPDPVQVARIPIVTPSASDSGAGNSGASSGAGKSGRIGAGATLVGLTTQQICSLANRPGDRFVVDLSHDVVGEGGAVLRAGTPVLIELASTPAEGSFGFLVKSVQVEGDLVTVQGTVRADGRMSENRIAEGNDKAKVIGGAVAGAILGKVLGGGTKGAVVGAAAGGAVGTIAASRSGKVERCLPAGSAITVTLSSPLVLAPGTQ